MEAMNLQLFCFLTLVSLHITRALHFHKEDYFQSRFAPIEDVYPYFLHEHDMDWLMASSQAGIFISRILIQNID